MAEEHHHWADVAAERTLAAHEGRTRITVAAGITPSGVVHIGNFREVITVDLVARALRDRGVIVRFVYSWDDFDVYRKVPSDAPKQEMLKAELGRSIADIPDPWCDHDSYASHHIATFEASIAPLGIAPEFIRQNQAYRAGRYAEGIRKALAGAATIRRILNDTRARTGARTTLEDDWLPLSGFCTKCGRDDLAFEWDGEWSVHVDCKSCGHAEDVDLRKGGNLKLPWRVDWPMRWAFEQVCFEPGGKDHSSAGGSYDTAKDIVREIYDWVAPQYVGYDFVTMKGMGGKISSSKGGVVTVADCLEVYEPEVLRWIFAGYRPNTEFQISFDADAIKLYEDFDRAVRLAHEADDGSTKDKKRQSARRTLQLASVDHRAIVAGSAPPEPVPFRHLSVIVQIFDGDIERALDRLEREGAVKNATERAAAKQRATCVSNWLRDHAPDEFRYTVRKEAVVRELAPETAALLSRVCDAVQAAGDDEAQLAAHMKAMAGEGIDMKAFYPVVYDLLLAREKGPKLTSLLATLGPDRALPLLRASLG
ncbi:MAG TPA: lysine--tRNA ligase [Nannocystaceae bacterium]|nr:lysine--tRNA ligase [Nannocystaceae bacterium]